MTFSFDADLSEASYRVRQMLGDTVDAGHVVEDETITYYLSTLSELATAARLARDLSARYARQVDDDVDGQSQKASQLFEHYRDLAKDLEAQAKADSTDTTTSDGSSFSGLRAFGTTATEVLDARDDCDAAANAPLRWYGWP